jgi:arylformamidase
MHTYDISLPISPHLPTWPGDPPFTRKYVSEIANGGNTNTSFLEICAHMGTHVDSPDHFLANGLTVESLPLNILCGRAYVLHLSNVDIITASDLENADILPDSTDSF